MRRRARRIFPALFAMLAVTLTGTLFPALAQRHGYHSARSAGHPVFCVKYSFLARDGWRLLCCNGCSTEPVAAHLVAGCGRAVLRVLSHSAIALLPPCTSAYCLGADRLCRRVAGRCGTAGQEQKRGGVLSFTIPRLGTVGWCATGVQRSATAALAHRAGAYCRRWLGRHRGRLLSLRRQDHLPWAYCASSRSGAAAIIHAGASGSSFVGKLLQLRPMVYVGLISYSLYLWHWPLMVLVRYATGMEPLTSWIPLLFVVSLLLGSLSYHFIEQLFRRDARFCTNFVFTSSVAFASVLALVSFVGLVRDGFETRFGADVVKLDKARTPAIPFRDCDSRPQESWCKLGASSATPSLLIWGDSHALAWAPAIDAMLQSANQQAMFAPSSQCPPCWASITISSQSVGSKMML